MPNRIIIMICCSLFLLISCSKKGSSPIAAKKIHTISDGSFFTRYYSYDEQKRLSRIDYDAGSSLRFTYSASGVSMQMYNAEAPNPDAKYDLTLVNEKAVSGRQYIAGNKVNEYSYTYDNEQRLVSAEISLKTNNTVTARHFYSFQYDAQNNLMEVRFKSMAGNVKQDSISLAKIYYTDRSYISWKDLGFDHFGTTTVSVENFGYGTYMPQLFGQDFRPNKNALKATTLKNYAWDAGTATWKAIGFPGTSNYDTGIYQYNEAGQLVGHGALKIGYF